MAGYFLGIFLRGGNIGVRAGGRGVLGVYYLLQNIITANLKGGRQQSRGGRFPLPPPLENTLQSSFHQDFEEPKGYILQGFFSGVRKNVLRKVIHLKVNEKRN